MVSPLQLFTPLDDLSFWTLYQIGGEVVGAFDVNFHFTLLSFFIRSLYHAYEECFIAPLDGQWGEMDPVDYRADF